MGIIQLTRGFETIVDDDIFEELSSYNWYASGNEGRPARRLRAGPRKLIYIYHQILHVLPWVMSSLGMTIDHINHDPLDNRKDNLRVLTHKDNMRNTTFYSFRSGVCLDNTHGKYKVYLDRPDKPRLNIGTFKTEDEAKGALTQVKRELGIEDN